jgi:hypothetical protein
MQGRESRHAPEGDEQREYQADHDDDDSEFDRHQETGEQRSQIGDRDLEVEELHPGDSAGAWRRPG